MFKEAELKKLDPTQALEKLTCLLQSAHAGEKAAANAYYGHAHSLFIKNNTEKNEILNIMDEELHHREVLFEMLKTLGAKPNKLKEIIMYAVGVVIALLCIPGGYYIPMYGAGKIERNNIVEYEVAARLAYLSGQHAFIETLLQFAEIEWDHELYFRKKVKGHFLEKVIPVWKNPGLREDIRKSYTGFTTGFIQP